VVVDVLGLYAIGMLPGVACERDRCAADASSGGRPMPGQQGGRTETKEVKKEVKEAKARAAPLPSRGAAGGETEPDYNER